jgi:hypothetical protein
VEAWFTSLYTWCKRFPHAEIAVLLARLTVAGASLHRLLWINTPASAKAYPVATGLALVQQHPRLASTAHQIATRSRFRGWRGFTNLRPSQVFTRMTLRAHWKKSSAVGAEKPKLASAYLLRSVRQHELRAYATPEASTAGAARREYSLPSCKLKASQKERIRYTA